MAVKVFVSLDQFVQLQLNSLRQGESLRRAWNCEKSGKEKQHKGNPSSSMHQYLLLAQSGRCIHRPACHIPSSLDKGAVIR